MALQAALDWLLIGVCVLTYGLLIGEAVGLVRRALALKSRVEKIADLPMFTAIPKAEADLDRLSNALLELQALALRAMWAIARIRATLLAITGFVHTLRGR
ncbi:MAG TPA: hypothetical protein VN905_03130 [Candidatus Binatia bacterium]|nr:hypothetical protein [Candidatus Binatia bacterium]